MKDNDILTNISASGMYSEAVCANIPEMPVNPQYAFAYIKFQCLDNVYDACEALQNGTAFPELNMPYCGWNRRPGV